MTDLKKHFSELIEGYNKGLVGANFLIEEVIDVLRVFGADSVLIHKRDELLKPFVDQLVKCIENDGDMAFTIEGWKDTTSGKKIVET